MSSQSKIAANRQNSQKSTGPRTEAGKNHAKFNALKLALYASKILLPGENILEYLKLCAEIIEDTEAEGIIQENLAEQVAANFWRLGRLSGTERIYLTSQVLWHANRRANPQDECRNDERANVSVIITDSNGDPIKPPKDRIERKRRTPRPNQQDAECAIAQTITIDRDYELLERIDGRRRAIMREITRLLAALRMMQELKKLS